MFQWFYTIATKKLFKLFHFVLSQNKKLFVRLHVTQNLPDKAILVGKIRSFEGRLALSRENFITDSITRRDIKLSLPGLLGKLPLSCKNSKIAYMKTFFFFFFFYFHLPIQMYSDEDRGARAIGLARYTKRPLLDTMGSSFSWNGSQYYLPLWRTSRSSGQ